MATIKVEGPKNASVWGDLNELVSGYADYAQAQARNQAYMQAQQAAANYDRSRTTGQDALNAQNKWIYDQTRGLYGTLGGLPGPGVDLSGAPATISPEYMERFRNLNQVLTGKDLSGSAVYDKYGRIGNSWGPTADDLSSLAQEARAAGYGAATDADLARAEASRASARSSDASAAKTNLEVDEMRRMNDLRGLLSQQVTEARGLGAQPGMTAQDWTTAGGDIADYNAITGRMSDEDVRQHRKDWKAETSKKYFDVMDQAFNRMNAMYEEAMMRGSNIPDQSLLTTYAKVLDPESVVRGSEVDALIESTGIRGLIQMFRSRLTSEGRLTDTDRAAFMSAAKALHSAAAKKAMETQGVYQERAKAGNRPGDIIWNPITEPQYPDYWSGVNPEGKSVDQIVSEQMATMTEEEKQAELARLEAARERRSKIAPRMRQGQ